MRPLLLPLALILVTTLLVLGVRGAPASAAINTVIASPTAVGPNGTSNIVVDADEGGGDLRIVTSAGSLTATCGEIALPCTSIRGAGTDTLVIPDQGNNLDVVQVVLTAPSSPTSVTVTAIQANTSRPVFISVRPEATASATSSATTSVTSSAAASATSSAAAFVAGSIPANGGFGLVVFGGGTFDQLTAAARCPGQSVAFWLTDELGHFIVFIPGASGVAAVNAPFRALFPNSRVPSGTPFIGRCLPATGLSAIEAQ